MTYQRVLLGFLLAILLIGLAEHFLPSQRACCAVGNYANQSVAIIAIDEQPDSATCLICQLETGVHYQPLTACMQCDRIDPVETLMQQPAERADKVVHPPDSLS